MISIKGLHKSYGKNQVLNGLDLEFSEPGITAILGPNGSGKTTLLKSILGMVIPDQGEIFVLGKKTRDNFDYREKIAFLPQIAKFPENLNASELLRMVGNLRKAKSYPDPLIQKFKLEESLGKKLKYLSGGTKQKVSISSALMFDCPILILDEPTAGLDPVALMEFKSLIDEEKKKGKIILLTTHILTLVHQLADRIVFLLEGKVFFNGTPKELLNKYDTQDFEEAIAMLTKQEVLS